MRAEHHTLNILYCFQIYFFETSNIVFHVLSPKTWFPRHIFSMQCGGGDIAIYCVLAFFLDKAFILMTQTVQTRKENNGPNARLCKATGAISHFLRGQWKGPHCSRLCEFFFLCVFLFSFSLFALISLVFRFSLCGFLSFFLSPVFTDLHKFFPFSST